MPETSVLEPWLQGCMVTMMENGLHIKTYSEDKYLRHAFEEISKDLVDSSSEGPQGGPRLAVLDARSYSPDLLRKTLAQPKTFGDMVLILVDSSEQILGACDSDSQLQAIDFLIWPTPTRILTTRIRLLCNYLKSIPSSSSRAFQLKFEAFHAVTEDLPLMILVTEANGETFMNAAMRRFLGVNSKSIEHMGWLGVTHPEYRDELRVKIEEAIALRQTYDATVLVVGSDGEWRMIHIVGRPHYYPDGSFSGMVDSVSEVTEQALTEDSLLKRMHRFEELANLAPLLIGQTDPNGLLTYANDRWYAYTGLPRHAVTASEWIGIIHPDDSEKVVKAFLRAKRDQSLIRLECRLWEKDMQRYKWHAAFAIPIRDERNHIVKWIASAMDIDARKINAEKITRLYQEMARKQQTKANFLAALSHELRTPLNIILGYCHLLLETMDPGAPELELQGITQDAHKILNLVEKLPWVGPSLNHQVRGDDVRPDAD